MRKWKVTDDRTRQNFNAELLERLDRVKTLDKDMKTLFDYQKIKQELATGSHTNTDSRSPFPVKSLQLQINSETSISRNSPTKSNMDTLSCMS